jgi:O-antigen ligase
MIGLASIVIAVAILGLGQRTNRKEKLGLLVFLGTILFLAWYAAWLDLSKRFNAMAPDWDPARLHMWKFAAQTARDFPIFGTGPGTFEPLAQFYLDPRDPHWMAQLHNDWLETVVTFGRVGFSLILLALVTVLSRWFVRGGIPAHRVFMMFLWLGLGGCLIYAVVDFPFQIYSILFLFLVICAVLYCLSRKV